MDSIDIAEGQDKDRILQDLEPLLREGGGRWSLIPNRRGIEANFQFKTFGKTWVCQPSKTLAEQSSNHLKERDTDTSI